MTVCEECGRLVQREVEGPQTVGELEIEMARVEELMKRLATHRSALRRSINSLAPIVRLPSEILLEIFSVACRSSITTPLFLGSICSGWRYLAWNTPLLWCDITLQVHHSHPKSKLQLLSEWLQRANALPLHIRLFSAEEDDTIFFSLRTIMEVLVTRSMYWGSIECLLPPQCHDLLPSRHFPILTKVSFRSPKGTISTFNQPPDMFYNSPLLEDVDLSGYDFSSMALPWTQLRKFRTQFLTVAECVKLLQWSPNLRHCYLENVYSPDNHSAMYHDSQLVHSELETLDITFIKGAATSLLDHISLPSLKDLGLHYVGAENVSLLPVVSLVSRSSARCTLRKLSISKSAFAEEDLMRCLEALPTLEELHICVRKVKHPTNMFAGPVRREGLTETFVRSLCRFLPELKGFSYEGVVVCPMAVVIDMLECRWYQSGMNRLESASISSRCNLSLTERDSKRLGDLATQGMRICIVQY